LNGILGSLNAVEQVLTSQTIGLLLRDEERVVHDLSLNQEIDAWLCKMAADETEVP
jgi:hypothetical protein